MATKAKPAKAKPKKVGRTLPVEPVRNVPEDEGSGWLTALLVVVFCLAVFALGAWIGRKQSDLTPSPKPDPAVLDSWGSDLADRKTIDDTDELRQTIKFLHDNGDINEKQEQALIVSIDRWGNKNAAFDEPKRAELRGVK